MWRYVAVFLTAFLVDSVPFVAPPAWPFLVFLLVHSDLNPWAVILLGVAGITLGRYLLTLYIPGSPTRFSPRTSRRTSRSWGSGCRVRRTPFSYSFSSIP